MLTRSQTKQMINAKTVEIEFKVDIDFDDASNCWRQNKKCLPNGMYKYVCQKIKKNGNKSDAKCGRLCYQNGEFCWAHRNSGTE